MKRVYGILVLIVLMIFGGCIGKKDERVTGGGSTPGGGGYTHTIGNITSLELEQLKFSKFNVFVEKNKEIKTTTHLDLEVDELEKISFEFAPNVDVKVRVINNTTFDKSEKIKELLKANQYSQIAFGEVYVEGEQKKAHYIKGEVNNVAGKKEILAFFITTSDRTYVVSRIAEIGDKSGDRVVEILARTLVTATDSGSGGGIIKPESDEVKYINAIKEAIELRDVNKMKETRDNLLTYVIRTYVNDPLLTQEEKMKKASEFIYAWEINEDKVLVVVNNTITNYYWKNMVLARNEAMLSVELKETDKRVANNLLEDLKKSFEELLSQRIIEMKAASGNKISAERAFYSLHTIYDYDYNNQPEGLKDIEGSIEVLLKNSAEVLRIDAFADNEKGSGIQDESMWEHSKLPELTYYSKLMGILKALTPAERESLFIALENEDVVTRKIAKEYLMKKSTSWLIQDADIWIGATSVGDRQQKENINGKEALLPRTIRMVVGYTGTDNNGFTIAATKGMKGDVVNSLVDSKREVYVNMLRKYNEDRTSIAKTELKNALVDYLVFAKYYDTSITIASISTEKKLSEVVSELNKAEVTEGWYVVKDIVFE